MAVLWIAKHTNVVRWYVGDTWLFVNWGWNPCVAVITELGHGLFYLCDHCLCFEDAMGSPRVLRNISDRFA